MTVIYGSRQDFAATMARCSKVSRFMLEHLPRTLANDSVETFERHLHDAMGYRSHTVDTDGF